MRSLADFLASLPGILPIKTRRPLEGDLLSAAERSGDRSFLDLVLDVGPDAAAAILATYKSGRLPMKKAQNRFMLRR